MTTVPEISFLAVRTSTTQNYKLETILCPSTSVFVCGHVCACVCMCGVCCVCVYVCVCTYYGALDAGGGGGGGIS